VRSGSTREPWLQYSLKSAVPLYRKMVTELHQSLWGGGQLERCQYLQ
jgi:hypothetical protein